MALYSLATVHLDSGITYTGTGGTKMARTYSSKSLLATYQFPMSPPGTHARETDSQPAIVIQLFLFVFIIDVIDR
jgi:hypothetical protein